MFISEEDAARRLQDPANIFSPKEPLFPEESDAPEADLPEPKIPDNIDPKKLATINSEILNGLRRGEGRGKRLHPAVRAGIAETSLITSTGIAAALADVDPTAAGSYVTGAHNNRDGKYVKHQYLLDRLATTRAVISTRAARRLKSVLHLLDEDKLNKVESAKELSAIGKDMAMIIEKMDEKKAPEATGIHFHIHKPEPRDPGTYEMVKIGTNVFETSPTTP